MKLLHKLPLLLAGLIIGASLLSVPAATAQNANMEEIFRCKATDEAGKAACLEARHLITNNCTLCHTFVPIVMQQFDSDGWNGLLDRHVMNGRADQLGPEQIAAIHDYLAANFNGELPPPELPPELLQTWTSY